MSETKLFVSGLPRTMSDLELYEMFARFGEVVSAKAWMNLETCECKGWGFVEMARDYDAYNARLALDGEWHDGKRLRIKESSA